jgi:acetyl-CoA synthetase
MAFYMSMPPENFESVSHENRSFDPPKAFAEQAYVSSKTAYQDLYERSIAEPEAFWAEAAQDLHWFKPWDSVLDTSEAPCYKWFDGAQTNISYNCLDRHLENGLGDRTALYWEGEPGDQRSLTFRELHAEVCRFANVLKKMGVGKGNRIAVYLPMIPELAI